MQKNLKSHTLERKHMKKTIIILITIFAFTTNIYALENISYTISGTNKSLCSKDGKIFLEIPSIDLDGKESYILKPMESFNTNLKTYEYAKYTNYDLPKDLKDYFYAFLEFKNIPGISHSNYHILTQRLIWDYLYPEMEIRFCTNRGKPFEFLEEEYYKVKDMITNIVSGPDFFNSDNYLLENKEYTFEFNYLDRFYLVSKPDELNVKIYDNKLFVSGPKGKYQLVFKKKPLENKPFISERIISDGQNEVFSYSNFNDKEYIVNIIIDSVNLNILILDENNKALTDKCIILQNEKEYLSYCTNENGIINAKGLLKGKYNILFEGTDEYEKINQDIDLNSDSMIKLKLILKNKDNVINNNNNSENIDNIDKEIAHKNADNTILCAQIKKYDIKIERIRTRKKSTFLNIITFNIYNALSSQKRIEKLATRKNNLQESVNYNSESIKNLTVQKISEQQTVADKKLVLDNNISSIERDKQNLFDNLGLALQKVIPLPFNIPAEQFIPLSSLAGMQQEKIVGCYIIRNRKNAKCYVGQSKDVLKRLRQHFKGTSPQNIIFSEDYFSTAPEERQSLFEFKIIPLSTKDELDKTEKDLIEAYAAFTHGYNKTNGNS